MAAVLSTRFARPVNDWDATWALASVTGVQIGHLCVAESEVAQVTKVGPATSVTVRRGVEGTAVGAHASGTPVAVYVAGAVDTDPVPIASAAAVSLRQATVTLTDAQIKTLPTTPVVVIPATTVLDYAGAPTQVPMLVTACLLTNYWPVAYSGAETGGLYLHLSSDKAFIVTHETSTSVLGSGNVDAVPLIIESHARPLYNGVFDNAIVLAGDLAWVSALTGGHAANTLTVSVLYNVLDVTTGRFA